MERHITFSPDELWTFYAPLRRFHLYTYRYEFIFTKSCWRWPQAPASVFVDLTTRMLIVRSFKNWSYFHIYSKYMFKSVQIMMLMPFIIIVAKYLIAFHNIKLLLFKQVPLTWFVWGKTLNRASRNSTISFGGLALNTTV